ncbi:11443_t:CDS:2 [Diversispora eburnea]|uniref:11443_t:CDS:1 n=1 Tax=Diversispora eburnea TaxID=1213867 RepID=A0A9N9BD59_9GLOM|nr:11443_t:CDS:2 [Diversispora eburnea]
MVDISSINNFFLSNWNDGIKNGTDSTTDSNSYFILTNSYKSSIIVLTMLLARLAESN